jgi:hypothetical protein
MMEYRNAEFLENGKIDCEINHPQYGWIPFTASPTDAAQHGRDLHALITSRGDAQPVNQARALAEKQARTDLSLEGMLKEVNRVASNALEWEELTEAEKNAYRQYRREIIALKGKGHTPETLVKPILNLPEGPAKARQQQQ